MVLKRIRKGDEVEDELKEIETDIESNPALGVKETLREMCTRRVLVRLGRERETLALDCTMHGHNLYTSVLVCAVTLTWLSPSQIGHWSTHTAVAAVYRDQCHNVHQTLHWTLLCSVAMCAYPSL